MKNNFDRDSYILLSKFGLIKILLKKNQLKIILFKLININKKNS